MAQRLQAQGFEILGRNVRVGRRELDLVARRGDLLVVCEVRTLSSDRLMAPAETITAAKVRNVRAAAAEWLREQRLPGVRVRFDAAGVVLGEGEPRVDYYEDAF